MKRYYKNILDLSITPTPKERRQNISKEIVRLDSYLPKPISYEDIDIAFKQWVENKIPLHYDGIVLPTMVLYSNQRFSEYMQTWKYTDENNNIRLNFKTLTRENNPNHGTIVGDTYNIPGNRFYTVKSEYVIDDSGKEYRLDVKMKQPTAVDLNYKISVMTNKYTIINDFNEIINHLFNSKQEYICPNGHYMSLIVENINDESEYNIEDRQFFSQSFTVKVRGYIIKPEDMRIEENPLSAVICFEGDSGKRRKPTIELSEYDACKEPDTNFYRKKVEIDIDMSFCSKCNGKIKFTMDDNFILTHLELKEPNNIVEDTIELYINDELITNNLLEDAFEGYKLCSNEEIKSDNILDVEFIPHTNNKNYDYIRYRNDIYKWHQIYFKDGDEILIKTQKIKRYINSSGLLLTGYDRFQTFSKNEPETMKELKDYLENSESNISIKASETCLNKQ